MNHGSLFSGIGGFDLAAQWMGWENVFHCEWNEFGQKILKYYWPDAKSYSDITKTDFTIHRGTIDILTGGFPCQPYSQAGKRLGKEDDRHLWPEMLRAIREIQPSWVVGENVSGLLNWNGGMVLNEIKTDLENSGFEVFPPCILPACGKNAPHRRDRLWIVAYSRHNSERKATHSSTNEGSEFATIYTEGQGRKSKAVFNNGLCDLHRDAANTTGKGFQGGIIGASKRGGLTGNSKDDAANTNSNIGRKGGMHQTEQQEAEGYTCTCNACSNQWNTWENFPTQSPICGRDDGISSQLVGITFPKHRNESIKAYGNAIVPQVAYQIFKAIALINL